ncbi:copper chaperone PCu(A)C [Croceicoccus sp. F390]|uniref:Copper chaperone PCu(A)C n=1 Tax=Croceicoccus esteveae TaxID=3075597 RepID=A0ABU2ZGU6_9SPHN|nr:copper chaperone PCu(A)C [Croceicoccus sp. F390]MDT0575539.1 copper chaperone PCu(A)C [Croceicoccus sp. F390]
MRTSSSSIRRPMWSRALLPAVLALILAGCGDATEAPDVDNMIPEITEPDVPEGVLVTQAFVRMPAATGRPAVAYFSVANQGDMPRNIVAVAVANAGRTELHQTTQANGVSSMRPVTSVSVQPGQSLAFQPGGYHVMLFDLDPAMQARTTADLTISFDNGDKASVAAPIIKPGDPEYTEGMMGKTS